MSSLFRLLFPPAFTCPPQTFFPLCSNFWFKFPRTSSKLEHFVSILLKCFDSPWTTRALSETVVEESDPKPAFSKMNGSMDKKSSTVSEDVEATVPMLQRTKSRIEQGIVDRSETGVLDKKEGEQAKALFEKVKKFRTHVEEGDIVYRLYMRQTIIKVIKFILIICYTVYYVHNIKFDVDCTVDIESLTGYRTYRCAHPLATLFKILASFYISLVIFYGLICMYTLWWMLRRSLKKYSFESIREESSYSDIPDVKNDFAFMLHLIDQYDPLYSKRFAVFLSEVSENKLRQLNLNNEWTLDKLRQRLTKNAQDKLELHLFMLSGIPDTVFDLVELEVLKLELIPDVTIPPSIAQLTGLKELWLYHTAAKIEAPALAFLRENLRALHIKFTDIKEIPLWIYSLKTLEELHLTGNLSAENNRYIVIDGLRELKRLKVLRLKSNLSKLPQVVTDVGVHLQKLSINNEGTKLIVLNSLKKMVNLTELELIRCDLERIPHSIFSLHNLQEIDLKDNNLKTIEEIISFQHLHRLTCLKLWYNHIAYIPIQIGNLTNLERLYLNRNKIEKIPPQLFYCRKLRYLDLSHNNLTFLPADIGLLQNLQNLAVTANRVSGPAVAPHAGGKVGGWAGWLAMARGGAAQEAHCLGTSPLVPRTAQKELGPLNQGVGLGACLHHRILQGSARRDTVVRWGLSPRCPDGFLTGRDVQGQEVQGLWSSHSPGAGLGEVGLSLELAVPYSASPGSDLEPEDQSASTGDRHCVVAAARGGARPSPQLLVPLSPHSPLRLGVVEGRVRLSWS